MEGGNNNISEGAKEKQAISFLLIEILLLMFIVGGALFALDRSGVISISKLIGKASPTPTIEKGQDLAMLKVIAPTDVPNVTGKIEVVSNNPGYTLEIKDLKSLQEYLTSFHLWGRALPKEDGKYSGAISKIRIHLTDKEQPNNKFSTPKNGLYMSTGTVYNGDTIDLYGYLSEYILNHKDRDRFFGQLIISATYRMANYKQSDDLKTVNSNLNTIYKEIIDRNLLFFNITKK